jgi:hypothetical protein
MVLHSYQELSGKDLPESLKAYMAALDYESACLCLHHNLPSNPHFFFSWAINITLSTELYFKCLLLVEGKQYRHKHDLSLHYNMLSIESQEAIKNTYLELIKTSNVAKNQKFKEIFPDVEWSDFNLMLNRVKDAFVEFRYHFQNQPKNGFNGVGQICVAVRHRIVELEPDYVEKAKKFRKFITEESK